MYYDWTYLLLIPCMLFALWAQLRVKSAFSKYSAVLSRSGLTGAEAARRILRANGIYDVQVTPTPGELTDHYDPSERVVKLSSSTYSATSVAALGVAAHEAGHACQHAESYAPLKWRNAIIPVTRIGSVLAMPLFLLGLLFSGGAYIGGSIGETLMVSGILLFSFSTLFQLLTLPTEFNASRRALQVLESQGMLSSDELSGARSVLNAAALTYVAALASSLVSLLRLLLIFNNNSRRR